MSFYYLKSLKNQVIAILSAINQDDILAVESTGNTRYFISKIKNINTRTGSYGLKHTCEDAIHHYIPNGIFIAAAIACGYKCKKIHSPNACFNMSMKDINKFRYPLYKGHNGPCLDSFI